jgi:quercetin dioxygenase-like cupin family protein
MSWEKVEGGGAVGRTKRMSGADHEAIRMLELDPKWDEDEWCTKKHAGYVLSGTLRLQLAAGPPLLVHKGEGFFVPKGCAHKAGCKRVTTLFLVD